MIVGPDHGGVRIMVGPDYGGFEVIAVSNGPCPKCLVRTKQASTFWTLTETLTLAGDHMRQILSYKVA